MQMLTVKEVASLKGCSERYIQKLASNGKIKSIQSENKTNKITFLIPLNDLPENLQQKYHKQRQSELVDVDKVVDRAEPKPLDHYSDQERKEIEFWTDLIAQWQRYRSNPDVMSKAEIDQKFETLCTLEHPNRNITVNTLYRKWKAIRINDMDGVIDKRGKWKKGKSTIHTDLWNAYMYYYLKESQYPIKCCYEYTKMWAQEVKPELVADIPSYETFYRHTYSDIPEPLRVLSREGEKAYDDKCGAYIRRIYDDDLESNEYWIADNHTFDVITIDKSGKQHRPYLTAFLDARSGIFAGWFVTYTPSSNATLVALRRGILKHGIPKNVYVDNGREFLTYDIGGLGHRKKKLKNGEQPFEPPGVFQRLSINMTNAIVRNAKAKIIERRFLDVKNQLSRIFETYTGGNVLEKPERLKRVLKKGEIGTDAVTKAIVAAICSHLGGCVDEAPSTEPPDNQGTWARCTGNSVNVRSGAGTNHCVLRQLNKDNDVLVIGQDGDWFNVNIEGLIGYVHSDYISTSAGFTEYWTDCTGNSVNVRSGAGLEHSVLRKLNNGNGILVIGGSGDWLNVNIEGLIGYVHKDYVK